jgi:hypothetical protein
MSKKTKKSIKLKKLGKKITEKPYRGKNMIKPIRI